MGTPRRTASGPSSRDLLILYISEALQSRARGIDAPAYFRVVEELSSIKRSIKNLGEEKKSYLISLLCSLAACISLINQKAHEALLTEVLGLPIWGASAVRSLIALCMLVPGLHKAAAAHSSPPKLVPVPGAETGQEVRQALLPVLGLLVLTNGSLTQQCLHKLVGALLPPPFVLMSQDAETLEGDQDVSTMQAEVCCAIQRILELVPTAASPLVSTVAASMPHVLRDRAAHVLYVRAVARLALGGAAPAVRAGLLAVVVEHLVALDCEIAWKDIATQPDLELELEEEPEEDEDIFQLEGQTEQLHVTQPGVATEAVESARDHGARSGFEGSLESSTAPATAHASTSGRTAADFFAEKLDSLMEVVLGQLEVGMQTGQAPMLWDCLLPVFQRSIMGALKCKFSQYLLWYLCMKAPVTAPQSLVSTLLSLLTDPSTPQAKRSSAAAYLASFLARSRFIPADMIIQALHGMAGWCLSYCTARPARLTALGPGGSMGTPTNITLRADSEAAARELAIRHQVFYAASQSLFYVICYRLEGIMQQADDQSSPAAATVPPSPGCQQLLRQLFASTMPQLLSHWLMPISACNPSVALEFGHLAKRLGLLPLALADAAIATARASAQAQEEARSQEGSRATRPLEMFFPFDPYLLRKSAARLELRSSYLRWSQVRAAAEVQSEQQQAGHEHEEVAEEEVEQDSSSSSSSNDEGGSSDDDSQEASSDDGSDLELEQDSLDRRKNALELDSTPDLGRKRRSQELGADVSSFSPEPETPAQQIVAGMPVPGSQYPSVRMHDSHEASRGSSPDVGSGGDPMSWTPHLSIRLTQQTA